MLISSDGSLRVHSEEEDPDWQSDHKALVQLKDARSQNVLENEEASSRDKWQASMQEWDKEIFPQTTEWIWCCLAKGHHNDKADCELFMVDVTSGRLIVMRWVSEYEDWVPGYGLPNETLTLRFTKPTFNMLYGAWPDGKGCSKLEDGEMTSAEAEELAVKCKECVGFTLEGYLGEKAMVYFKRTWTAESSTNSGHEWTSCVYIGESEEGDAGKLKKGRDEEAVNEFSLMGSRVAEGRGFGGSRLYEVWDGDLQKKKRLHTVKGKPTRKSRCQMLGTMERPRSWSSHTVVTSSCSLQVGPL
jgi:hypothetical protein